MNSEQADLVVSAVEKFAQVIPLNMEEIFIWYFEQKGVDNPERFLAGVNYDGVNTDVNQNLSENVKINNEVLSQAPQPQQNQNEINPIMQILGKVAEKGKKEFDISDVISKIKRNKIKKGN